LSIAIIAIAVGTLNTVEVVSEIQTIKVLPADYNPYQALYNEMLYPTVRIESESGIGSGVVINRRDPSIKLRVNSEKSIYILSAAHVVGNQSIVTVTLYSQNVITSLPASVVITDTIKDLALLRTPINADLKDIIHKAKLASKDYKPFLFAPIYTVGCSLGLDPRPSSGIITAIRDNLRSSASNWEISAPILPGNSGGPVYSADTREVTGIAVWVKVYHGQLITTMAGIVPISKIHLFLDKIRKPKPEILNKHQFPNDQKQGFNHLGFKYFNLFRDSDLELRNLKFSESSFSEQTRTRERVKQNGLSLIK
jgi:S1-C subfamily serine protease